MGRTRGKDKHLPPRMQKKGGSYYWTPFVDGKVKWVPLGNDYVQALLKWRDHEGLSEGAATVAQLLDNALSALVNRKKPKPLAPGTLREFSRACNTLKPSFEGFRPMDLTPAEVAQYLEKRSAPVAANREVSFLSTAWDLARRRGWINLPNPCLGVGRNPEKKRKRIGRPAEIAALVAPQRPEADMVMLTLMTAIRQADLRFLTRHAIEDEGLRVKPQKTDDSTEVELFFRWTPELLALIDRAKARAAKVGSIYLFPASRGRRRGQPYTRNSFVSVYRKYFARCKVEGLTWHDLRRTALNKIRDVHGKDAAQVLAGHSSMVTTEGYLANVGAFEIAPVAWDFRKQ
jgi:integrase